MSGRCSRSAIDLSSEYEVIFPLNYFSCFKILCFVNIQIHNLDTLCFVSSIHPSCSLHLYLLGCPYVLCLLLLCLVGLERSALLLPFTLTNSFALSLWSAPCPYIGMIDLVACLRSTQFVYSVLLDCF